MGLDKSIKDKTVDFRHFIDGHNWHEPEHDGRWSGPGARSTLRLPNMPAGRYTLTLNIVAAMSRAILDGVTLVLNEERLNTKILYRSDLKGAFASASRARVKFNSNALAYPAKLTTQFTISKEKADQPISLEINLPQTISPMTLGETDTRSLGIRCSSLEMKQR